MTAPFILVGGGVRSGKSAFAVERALRLGSRRAFVATAQAFDDEMRTRIDAHIRERGTSFQSVEAPFELPETLAGLTDVDVVVIDCLTLWLSNLLLRDATEADIATRVEDLATVLRERRRPTILVTNEVGMGIVPESRLGRIFRDVSGRAHQRLAQEADELYLAAMGVILRLRPSPVDVVIR